MTTIGTNAWSSWTFTTNSSTSSGQMSTWAQWTDDGTCSASNTVWTQWIVTPNTSSCATYTVDNTWNIWITTAGKMVQQVETDEERAKREAHWAEERRQYEAKVEEERKLRLAAEERAEKLLKEHLDPEEKARYERAGYFLVKSHKGNLYKVKKGTHGNVIRIDPITKEEIESLCVQPSGVPTGDSNLTQKLWIEHAEEEFRRIANIRQLPRRAANE